MTQVILMQSMSLRGNKQKRQLFTSTACPEIHMSKCFQRPRVHPPLQLKYLSLRRNKTILKGIGEVNEKK